MCSCARSSLNVYFYNIIPVPYLLAGAERENTLAEDIAGTIEIDVIVALIPILQEYNEHDHPIRLE